MRYHYHYWTSFPLSCMLLKCNFLLKAFRQLSWWLSLSIAIISTVPWIIYSRATGLLKFWQFCVWSFVQFMGLRALTNMATQCKECIATEGGKASSAFEICGSLLHRVSRARLLHSQPLIPGARSCVSTDKVIPSYPYRNIQQVNLCTSKSICKS